MTDYREPKVTTIKSRSKSTGTWVGIALAVLIIALLVWWFWPSEEPEVQAVPVVPGETVVPGAEPVAPVR